MSITLQARVELDPMAVPLAASMGTGRASSFDEVLQEVVDAATAPDETATAEPASEPTDDTAVPAEDTAAADPAPVALPTDREAPAEPVANETNRDVTAGAVDVTESTRRGEPVRQETAGKGADSPRSLSNDPATSPLAAGAHNPFAQALPGRVAGGAGQAAGAIGAVGAAGGAKGAGAAPAGGVDLAAARPSLPPRAAAVTAGYRTQGAVHAQLLEQARDSVFKQVLMQLGEGGGELRMRLQPPELGELDLRMVVEGGNRLTLSISAERADLAQLLQKHLDELKQTLQSQGLQVTDAQVHTGTGRGHAHGDGQRGGAAGQDDAADAAATHSTTRQGGWISAEGLDFWV